MGRSRLRLWGLLYCLMLTLACFSAKAEQSDEPYARVNDKVLTKAELETAVYLAVRQRFYHGRMDDKRLESVRIKVLGELIDRMLLLDEARDRGIKVDSGQQKRLYLELRRRYDVESMPKDHRQQVEAEMRQRAEEQVLLLKIESDVKSVSSPSGDKLRLFYQENLDKFTTPPRLHLSVILLKVVPSAPVQAWQAAEDEAKQLRNKIEAGANFADLARLHSGDASAENGGDLGFVHQGMLSQEAQKAVENLAVGALSTPVVLLQGVALFRIEGRQEAKVNPFEHVRERAEGLWQREQADKAWERLLRSLRVKAKIEIFDNNMTATMIWAQKKDVVQ